MDTITKNINVIAGALSEYSSGGIHKGDMLSIIGAALHAIKLSQVLPIVTLEQTRDECYADLKEIAHFFGGWDNLRKEIYHLEVGDNEPSDGEAWSGGIAENH